MVGKTLLETSEDAFQQVFCQDPKVFANMPFNGAFVIMPREAFQTKWAVCDQAFFESSIVDNKGTAALDYCKPGSAIPSCPTRYCIKQSNNAPKPMAVDPLLDRVIVLHNGNDLVQPLEKKLFGRTLDKEDGVIRNLSHTFTQQMNKVDFTGDEGCYLHACAARNMHEDSEDFVNKLFDQYFPDVNKEDYILYLMVDPVTAVTLAISNDEEDDVYVGNTTLNVAVDNNFLQSSSSMAQIRPLYHSSNLFYTGELTKQRKKVKLATQERMELKLLGVEAATAAKASVDVYLRNALIALVLNAYPMLTKLGTSGVDHRLRYIKSVLRNEDCDDGSVSSEDLLAGRVVSLVQNYTISPSKFLSDKSVGDYKDPLRVERLQKKKDEDGKIKPLAMQWLHTDKSCAIASGLVRSGGEELVLQEETLAAYYGDSLMNITMLMDWSSCIHAPSILMHDELVSSKEKDNGRNYRCKPGPFPNWLRKLNPNHVILASLNGDLGSYKSQFVYRALIEQNKDKTASDETLAGVECSHPDGVSQDRCLACGVPFCHRGEFCMCFLLLNSTLYCKKEFTDFIWPSLRNFWTRYFHGEQTDIAQNKMGDFLPVMQNYAFNSPIKTINRQTDDLYFGNLRLIPDTSMQDQFNRKRKLNEDEETKSKEDEDAKSSEYENDFRDSLSVANLIDQAISENCTFLTEDMSINRRELGNKDKHEYDSSVCDVGKFDATDYATRISGQCRFSKIGKKSFNVNKLMIKYLLQDHTQKEDYDLGNVRIRGVREIERLRRAGEDEESDEDEDDNLPRMGKRKRRKENTESSQEPDTIDKLARSMLMRVTKGHALAPMPDILHSLNDSPALRQAVYEKCQKLLYGWVLPKCAVAYISALGDYIAQQHKTLTKLLNFQNDTVKFDLAISRHIKNSDEKLERKINSCIDLKNHHKILRKVNDSKLAYTLAYQRGKVSRHLERKPVYDAAAIFDTKKSLTWNLIDSQVSRVASTVDNGRYRLNETADTDQCINVQYYYPLKIRTKIDVFAPESEDISQEARNTTLVEKPVAERLSKEMRQIRDADLSSSQYYEPYPIVNKDGRCEPLCILAERFKASQVQYQKFTSETSQHSYAAPFVKTCAGYVKDYYKVKRSDADGNIPVALGFMEQDLTKITSTANGILQQLQKCLNITNDKYFLVDLADLIERAVEMTPRCGPILHVFWVWCELYGPNGFSNARCMDEAFERDELYCRIICMGILNLFFGPKGGHETPNVRSFEHRPRLLMPVRFIYTDGNNLTTYANIQDRGSQRDHMMRLSLDTYQGKQKSSDWFTRITTKAGCAYNNVCMKLFNITSFQRKNHIHVLSRSMIEIDPELYSGLEKGPFANLDINKAPFEDIRMIVRGQYITPSKLAEMYCQLMNVKMYDEEPSDFPPVTSVYENPDQFIEQLAARYYPHEMPVTVKNVLGDYILGEIFPNFVPVNNVNLAAFMDFSDEDQ